MTVYAKLVAGRVRELTEKGEPVDLAVAASDVRMAVLLRVHEVLEPLVSSGAMVAGTEQLLESINEDLCKEVISRPLPLADRVEDLKRREQHRALHGVKKVRGQK